MPANDIVGSPDPDASGKDVTVTTIGGANSILPNATLHRVELLSVLPNEYLS